MNDIFLKGVIKDIQPSHSLKDIDYDKAHLIVRNSNGKESTLDLVFKHFSNKYTEDQTVCLVGNVRTLSKRLTDGKNNIHIYVFSYLDELDEEFLAQEPLQGTSNYLQLSGRICKIEPIRTFKDKRCNVQFIIANRIEKGNTKISSYLPCIAWGKLAKYIASNYQVNSEISIVGELRSREYKKYFSEDQFEIRVAHEVLALKLVDEDEQEADITDEM